MQFYFYFNEQTNLFCFVCFFAFHIKQIKKISFVFWENLQRANSAFNFFWPLGSSAFRTRATTGSVSSTINNSAYPKLKKIDFSTFDCILYSEIKSHNYKAGFKACGFKQSNQLSKISIKVHCRESIKFHESQGKTSGIALVNVYFQSSSTYDPLSQIAIGCAPYENTLLLH